MNGFKVYDTDGNNVTDNHRWFIGTDGELYRLTDNGLETVDGFWIEIL